MEGGREGKREGGKAYLTDAGLACVACGYFLDGPVYVIYIIYIYI